MALGYPILLFWCDVQNRFYFLMAPFTLLSGLSFAYVAPLISAEIFLEKGLGDWLWEILWLTLLSLLGLSQPLHWLTFEVIKAPQFHQLFSWPPEVHSEHQLICVLSLFVFEQLSSPANAYLFPFAPAWNFYNLIIVIDGGLSPHSCIMQFMLKKKCMKY